MEKLTKNMIIGNLFLGSFLHTKVECSTQADESTYTEYSSEYKGTADMVLIQDRTDEEASKQENENSLNDQTDQVHKEKAEDNDQEKDPEKVLLQFINSKPKKLPTAAELEELLKNNVDVNMQGNEENTLLHIAAKKGDREITEKLLEAGANPNLKNQWKKTPLLNAVANMPFNIDADSNEAEENDSKALNNAVFDGYFGAIKLLIEKGANINDVDENGISYFNYAIATGQEDIVKLLIEKGANINIIDEVGSTPMSFALSTGKENIVKLLLEKGAKINAKGKDATTLFFSAVSGQNLDIINLLIEEGADLNAKDERNNTLLHSAVLKTAAYGGNLDIVKLLLEKGADPNAKDKDGSTPLHTAVYYGNEDVVKLLLEKRADPNAKGKEKITPLHTAVYNRNKSIIKLLLKKGANPNARHQCMTPFQYYRFSHGPVDQEIKMLMEAAIKK